MEALLYFRAQHTVQLIYEAILVKSIKTDVPQPIEDTLRRFLCGISH